MPTGPGDDILDAIEAGSADKDILSKYKINNDQLKAFKTLHYGLTNQEVKYSEIGDYFPDLKNYFGGGSKPAPKQDAQSVIGKPDFTKPVHEKAATESTAAPVPQAKYTKAGAESGKPVLSLQQKFNLKAEKGQQAITNALHTNDDVIKTVINDFKLRKAQNEGFDKFAQGPRTDMPAAAQLANMRGNILPPATKPEDLPVTDEELNTSKEAILNDPDKARQFINQVVVHKPEKAPELQSSMYMLDAGARLEKDPNIALTVNDILEKLQKRELKYNSVTRQLIKELGPIDALVSGVRERARQLDNYDIFQGPDADVIKVLEKRMAQYDPDKPVEMPKGFGEVSQMLGMEWSSLLKGMAVNAIGAATSEVGGEALAPYVAAAVNGPEYYKRGYSTALEETYSEARQMGKTPEEALKMAQDQAKTEGSLGALEGGASAFFGGRIGFKELPKFNITGGFKNAASQLLKHTTHFAAETTVEGLADGLTAGVLQSFKDDAAIDKGLFRDTEKNIRDNIKGELTFALSIGGMTQVGRKLISPDTYSKIKYFLGKQNQQSVQSSLGNMVMTGQISKADADNITQELKEQHALDKTVPQDVKDVSRMAMLDKIKERDALEAEKKTIDKALWPEKQERIDKLNEEILEHSKHKKEEHESETKAETQADAEAKSSGNVEPGPEEISQPEAAKTKQDEGGIAPVADMHYTNPEGTQYVLRGEDLYHVGKDGKETKFDEKAMKTKETQELVAKIKEANQQASIQKQIEALPSEQWQKLRGNLPGNLNINTTTEMANAYNDGDPAVVEAVNKYIKPQTQENAVSEQGPEGVHVPTSSSDSAQVGQGNESQGAVNEEPTGKEEIKINTEEDLEREINKVYQNKAPKMDEMAPKEINNKISENTFQQYHNKAKAVLDKLLPGLKIKVYNDSDEYYQTEKRPKGSLGSYDPVTHSIAFNMPLIEKHGKQLNVFHEILHPIVNKVIGENQEHLDSLFGELEGLKGIPELADIWRHHDEYFNRGAKIQKVEAITQFLTYVADGRIDTSKMAAKTITKIIDVINKILAALGIDKQLSTASDLKRLSDSIIQAFQEQNTEPLETTLGNRISNFSQTGTLDQLTGSDQENALREIIKKTPASISDEKLKEIIVRASGISEQDAQDLIDEIRKPVVPPKPVIPTSVLTKEERQVLINQVNNAINQPKPKEPSWISKQWAEIKKGLKDGSAWLDNPYRFVTKITEEINKHYGLANKEVIPLGRQFEKSSSGRAALKIYNLVNDVINGKINGEKLGRLKGEKYKDFQKFLFCKRVIDRLNKQEELAKSGQASNRQTGNVTRQAAEVSLEELTNKYGNLDDFNKRAEAFQKHLDTMLQTLVAGGNLSKETYDKIKADNDFYAPFSVVQAKLLAGQDKQPVGISGVVKRIKGIGYKLPTTQGDALTMINSLGDALNKKIISPEEYFNTSFQILNDAKQNGLITEAEYDQHIASLENPGFAINDMLDAAANMIYKAEGMALKNTMLQRLYAYKASDTEGLFIQDVDGFKATTMPDGSVRMIPKPLNQIEVEPGMAPIKLRVDGKDKIVAVNKNAAERLTQMSNYETASLLKTANFVNKIFRATVITLSPGFQVKNFIIDAMRTMALSRYGPITGNTLPQNLVNAVLFVPQYIDALLHSVAGNVGYNTETYKQWMNSDSFSKGMFENLFDNQKRIKDIGAPLAKRLLNNLLNFHWIEVPGTILEQTPKLMIHQRGLAIEGFKPEMATAMIQSIINKNIQPNMTQDQLREGLDKINYEVQNQAGSPNFQQTHKWMKILSIYFQFFGARMKGEMTDYRRIGNIFLGRSEGVPLSKRETKQLAIQFASTALLIGGYAIRNILKDDDEKDFNGISPWHQDNNINIPLGYFEYTDEDNNKQTIRDYAKIPLRGVTATMNVMANSFVKFYKRKNPEEFKRMAEAFIGNASPINLNGKDEREMAESLASNLTPMFKYFVEYSFNRDTHNHRNIIPDYVQGKGMLSKFRRGEIDPWEVATKNTPQWAKDMSKYLFDTLGVRISAIELDHMENTMGNPTELYDKVLKKNFLRSESKYPLYEAPNESKNTSSATVTPVP